MPCKEHRDAWADAQQRFMLRHRLMAFCSIPRPGSFRATSTQTHARPIPGSTTEQFVAAAGNLTCSGRISEATQQYERAAARDLRRGQTLSNHTTTPLNEPTPAAEPFAGDGEERWVHRLWCSNQEALQRRISSLGSPAGVPIPCLHTIRALSGHAPWC